MARRGVSETQRQAAALQGARRMIALGERPGFRLRIDESGRWIVEAMPWLQLPAVTRRELSATARSVIAEWLEVAADTFDVET